MPMPVDFRPTEIPDVKEVVNTIYGDDRGFFSELYNHDVWEKAGFNPAFAQDNLSKSARGTLRGLHYQLAPHAMGKLVRAFTGAIYDVAVDLRKGAPTFGQWVGRELNDENRLALWIPPGFAHGFVALADHTLVFYKCTATHHPEAERALRWDDPQLGIRWPLKPTTVSDKDAAAPGLAQAEYNFTYTAG